MRSVTLPLALVGLLLPSTILTPPVGASHLDSCEGDVLGREGSYYVTGGRLENGEREARFRVWMLPGETLRIAVASHQRPWGLDGDPLTLPSRFPTLNLRLEAEACNAHFLAESDPTHHALSVKALEEGDVGVLLLYTGWQPYNDDPVYYSLAVGLEPPPAIGIDQPP